MRKMLVLVLLKEHQLNLPQIEDIVFQAHHLHLWHYSDFPLHPQHQRRLHLTQNMEFHLQLLRHVHMLLILL
jgi:hypothetical protein